MGLVDQTPANSDWQCDGIENGAPCTATGTGTGMGFPSGWGQVAITPYDTNGNPLPSPGAKVLCATHLAAAPASMAAIVAAQVAGNG